MFAPKVESTIMSYKNSTKTILNQNSMSIFSASYLLTMFLIRITKIPKAIFIATRKLFSNSFTPSIFPTIRSVPQKVVFAKMMKAPNFHNKAITLKRSI